MYQLSERGKDFIAWVIIGILFFGIALGIGYSITEKFPDAIYAALGFFSGFAFFGAVIWAWDRLFL